MQDSEEMLEGEEGGEYEEAVLDALERIEELATRTAEATEAMTEALTQVAELLANLSAG